MLSRDNKLTLETGNLEIRKKKKKISQEGMVAYWEILD